MIRIEFSSIKELVDFVNLFKHLDDDQIKNLAAGLSETTDKLIEAEKKQGE